MAALRLAARHAGQDAELLLRIGESLAEHGELNWASRLLNRAIESDARSFRAAIGLAELALNSGKLAHVVHHYRAAQALARDPALARFAAREADYYLRLSADDDYLDAELRRLGWLQNTQRARHLAARVGIASGVFALGATAWNPSLAAAGWALASSSAVVWMSVSLADKFFAERSKARSAD